MGLIFLFLCFFVCLLIYLLQTGHFNPIISGTQETLGIRFSPFCYVCWGFLLLLSSTGFLIIVGCLCAKDSPEVHPEDLLGSFLGGPFPCAHWVTSHFAQGYTVFYYYFFNRQLLMVCHWRYKLIQILIGKGWTSDLFLLLLGDIQPITSWGQLDLHNKPMKCVKQVSLFPFYKQNVIRWRKFLFIQISGWGRYSLEIPKLLGGFLYIRETVGGRRGHSSTGSRVWIVSSLIQWKNSAIGNIFMPISSVYRDLDCHFGVLDCVNINFIW